MNKISRIVGWTVLILFIGSWTSWGQTGSQAKVSGTVAFTDGTPAEGVQVVFFDLADLRRAFSGTTDEDGRFEIALETSSSSASTVPTTFRLLQNFPNPFNPSTTIPYELQQTSHVRLEVFNVLGQPVKVLVDEMQTAGPHTAVWDATDEGGLGVAAGLYVYRLTVDGVSDARQMVLTDGAASSTAGGWSPRQASSASSSGISRAYGLTISGRGIMTYVQPELLVHAGMGTLSFAVERATAEPKSKPAAGSTRILGDVNNDGRVNISDALIVATYGLDSSITIPNNGDITLGDVNGDGRINISDALIIATYGIDPSNSSLPQWIGQPVEEKPGTTFTLPGGTTMEMVWIAPGTFMMGYEGDQHEVTITKGFWLGKFELTQRQWQAVMGTTPWSGGRSYVRENPNNPAVYISWNDVQDFIAKLNQAEGSEVYRLPTEAEWEYACRAGTTTRWSFGDDESQLGEYAWYDANAWDVGEKYAHVVGTKLPNPWGLYDMHGNVYEWCQDWYGSYSSSPQTDPMGPTSGSSRVFRGGGFRSSARNLRSVNRGRDVPRYHDGFVGARLLRQGQ